MIQIQVIAIGWELNYSRNRILTKDSLLQLQEVALNKKQNLLLSYLSILKHMLRLSPRTKVVYIPALNQGSAPISIALAKLKGKKVITDLLISSYDTVTDDRKIAGKRSLRALKAYVADYVCVKLSDLILCDTYEHKDYFIEQYGCKPERALVIPVGSEDIFRPLPEERPYREGKFSLLFYGGFSPMHGIDTILHAAKRLAAHRDFHFVLVGGGQTKAEMVALAETLALDNVEFIDFIPYEQLPAFINRFDVGLGIFGETGKAFRVVPNKVYQMAGCGRPVITLDTPGIREVFTDGEDICLLPRARNDADGLAEQLVRLRDDEALRRRLGQGAARLMAGQLAHRQLQGAFERAVAELNAAAGGAGA